MSADTLSTGGTPFPIPFTLADVTGQDSFMVTVYDVETWVMVPSGRVRKVKVKGFRVTVYADGRPPAIVGIAARDGRDVSLGYDEPERILAILQGTEN